MKTISDSQQYCMEFLAHYESQSVRIVSKRLNYIIRGKTIMPKARAIWTLRLL